MIEIGEADGLSQFPFGQLADWLSEGNIVPFVGSGASRAGTLGKAQLPDGRGLAEELASKMPRFSDRAHEGLAKVAQVFEHIAFDRDALYDYLHKRFEAEQVDRAPGGVAAILAKIPHGEHPLFLITTNYDTFIERAFTEADKPICVISQNLRHPEKKGAVLNVIFPDGTNGGIDSLDFEWRDQELFPPGCTFLFKMHGSARLKKPNPADDVIITEDDYVDFMVTTGGTVSPFFPPPSLTLAYKQRRFLFLGYSLYDWNFRAFLRLLALRNALSGHARKRHFAIQLAPDALEVDLWQRRNVNVFDGELDAFCEGLLAEFRKGVP